MSTHIPICSGLTENFVTLWENILLPCSFSLSHLWHFMDFPIFRLPHPSAPWALACETAMVMVHISTTGYHPLSETYATPFFILFLASKISSSITFYQSLPKALFSLETLRLAVVSLALVVIGHQPPTPEHKFSNLVLFNSASLLPDTGQEQ